MVFFWKKSDTEKKAEEGSKEAILKLIEEGKKDKAISILEKFQDREDLRPILFDLLFENKRYYEAYKLLAIDENLGTVPEKARIYEELGYVDKAIELYKKIGNFDSLYKAANILRTIGHFKEALEIYERIRENVPYDKKKELEENIFNLKKILGIAELPKESLKERFQKTLSKTKDAILFATVFRNREVNDELFDEIEEKLVRADINPKIVIEVVENLKKEAIKRNIKTSEALKDILKEELKKIIKNCTGEKDFYEIIKADKDKPFVILLLGVNGSGKTTTAGKLASIYSSQGKKVILGAADTFRAAAIEQLEVWATRSNALIEKKKEGSDPAAVSFDTVQKALNNNIDVVIVDTAGRLHTKEPLINELRKIKKSIQKAYEKAPHETLLVLDSTIGQNAISQAKIFKEAVDISGIVLTKMDGTAKGGSAISICKELKTPIVMIGDGEGIEDLDPFDPDTFIDALLD